MSVVDTLGKQEPMVPSVFVARSRLEFNRSLPVNDHRRVNRPILEVAGARIHKVGSVADKLSVRLVNVSKDVESRTNPRQGGRELLATDT
jgi:hypothetical protein